MESKMDENKSDSIKQAGKITRHDITMLGIRSSLLQAAFSYERMQAGGWTWAQLPLLKKIFKDDKEELSKAMLDWFTLMPIVGGIAASFAAKGNLLGPILFLIVYIAVFLCKIPFAHLGYNLGTKAIDVIQENSDIIARVATIMGLTVIGALISSYVSFSLKVKIGSVNLQKDFLDKIFPNILPLAFTFFLFWLLKKKISPIVLIAVVFVFCIVCSFFGIM